MLKLCQTWFSTSATTFEAFWAHPLKNLLAVQERNLPDFWTFGAIYFHLHRDRVSESLWKPHKSKVLNFLHRNYTSVFFPTPKKIFFFRATKKYLKNIFARKWKSEDFLKIENVDQFVFFLDQNFRFSKKIGAFFSNIFFRYFFLWSDFFILFLELEKKLMYSFDVKNAELSIYEVFRAIPTLCRDVGANIWHQKFKIPLLDR